LLARSVQLAKASKFIDKLPIKPTEAHSRATSNRATQCAGVHAHARAMETEFCKYTTNITDQILLESALSFGYLYFLVAKLNITCDVSYMACIQFVVDDCPTLRICCGLIVAPRLVLVTRLVLKD
jgi:hypothetical protein